MIDKIKGVLQKLEIKNSDSIVLFIDSDILKMPGTKNKEHCENILNVIFDVIGIKGTIVTPSFNYDFCDTGYFDVHKPITGWFFFELFII